MSTYYSVREKKSAIEFCLVQIIFDNVPTWHIIPCIPGSVIVHFIAAVIESSIGFIIFWC